MGWKCHIPGRKRLTSKFIDKITAYYRQVPGPNTYQLMIQIGANLLPSIIDDNENRIQIWANDEDKSKFLLKKSDVGYKLVYDKNGFRARIFPKWDYQL